MARIIYTLGELAGSIGGMTFQRNNAGSIVRTRPRPNKSTTIRQSQSHINHTKWIYQWQQLTQTQRDNWITYASTWTKLNKFGQVKTLTGLNWFETSNYYRPSLNEAILFNPPIHTLPQNPPSFEVQLSDSTLNIYLIDAHDYNGSPLIIWVSAPTNKNTPSINQTQRKAMILDNLVTNPVNITTEWQLATGLQFSPTTSFPNANIYVCLQSISRSSGITSPFLCSKEHTGTLTEQFILTDSGDYLMTDTNDQLTTN